MKSLDLSIIIVNWNSVALLRQCLQTVYEYTTDLQFEVIVVDNASGDGCGEMLRQSFPSVCFIQSNKNLGFARANNLGFEHSSARNLLFLNPDTELTGPCLQRMVEFLDSNTSAGVVGPKLLNSDGSIQTSCIRSFPSLLNEALDTDFLRDRFPRWGLWGTRPLFEKGTAPAVVDAVSGASLMIKRRAFLDAGRFTTDFFMYSEDVDLCFQARRANWMTYYLPEVVVIHHGGQSTASRDDRNFSDVVMRESRLRFFQARAGQFYAGAYQASTTLVSLVRLGLIRVVLLVSNSERRSTLRRSYAKWQRILRWSLGRESWSRQLAS